VLEKSAKWLTLSINYLLTSDKLVLKDPSYIPLEQGTLHIQRKENTKKWFAPLIQKLP